MLERDLSLTLRVEGVRNIIVSPPVHFSLDEIWGHFTESLDEIKKQFSVAEELKQAENIEGCKTIWRSQVVLTEGLLDFFIHEMSKYCLFEMFTGQWEKTEKYGSIMVPLTKVEDAINVADSNEWFFEYLNNRFSRDVFLSLESMRDQLNLIGIGFVQTMIKAFPRDKEEISKKDGSIIIKELFQRRNEIAHQNDRSHATAEQTDITREFVEDYLDKVESISKAIWDIAKDKDIFFEED